MSTCGGGARWHAAAPTPSASASATRRGGVDRRGMATSIGSDPERGAGFGHVRLTRCGRRPDNAGMPLQDFHPAVAAWFADAFPGPTEAQRQAWPRIRGGEHVLVAAPTGSGKTLTAFLAAIDALVRRGLGSPGGLPDETLVVYVSPLKALSNDIHLNLEAPLAG